MADLFSGPPEEAGGGLTRESFLRAVEAVKRSVAGGPTRIITSQRTIDRGRYAARALEAGAGYAEDELLATSRWRWLRRRTLRRQIADRSRNAESLRQTFGYPPQEGEGR